MNKMISVIIPTYNSEQFILQSVISVFKQSYKNYELIVVDDGSTDNTRNLLNQYRKNLQYIYQKNSGVSSARNTGIKKSKGEYIAILESDDFYEKYFLEELAEFIDIIDTDIVYCNMNIVDENNKNIGIRYKKEPEPVTIKRMLIQNYIVPSQTLIRKKLIENIGLFDEQIEVGDDWDFWLRALLNGCNFKYLNKCLTNYRVYKNQSRSFMNIDKAYKNELLILDKFYANFNLPPELFKIKNLVYTNRILTFRNLYLKQKKFYKSIQCYLNAVKLNKKIFSDPQKFKIIKLLLRPFLCDFILSLYKKLRI